MVSILLLQRKGGRDREIEARSIPRSWPNKPMLFQETLELQPSCVDARKTGELCGSRRALTVTAVGITEVSRLPIVVPVRLWLTEVSG